MMCLAEVLKTPGQTAAEIAVAVGASGGERVLRCVGSPACVAKNRYGLSPELPLSWPDLMAGLTQNPVIQKGEEAHG